MEQLCAKSLTADSICLASPQVCIFPDTRGCNHTLSSISVDKALASLYTHFCASRLSFSLSLSKWWMVHMCGFYS